MYTAFWWENLREGDHLENPGVDGRIILRWIFKMWGIDWIDLAQDTDRWRELNAVMNLRVPQNVGNFLTEDWLASQGLCSME